MCAKSMDPSNMAPMKRAMLVCEEVRRSEGGDQKIMKRYMEPSEDVRASVRILGSPEAIHGTCTIN